LLFVEDGFFFYEVWKTETQIVDFLIINFLLHD